MEITGSKLKELGYRGAPWWKAVIADSACLSFETDEEIRAFADHYEPVQMSLRKSGSGPRWSSNIRLNTDDDLANYDMVAKSMDELVRVPTVIAATIMPDACPYDLRLGVIPVGGVAACKSAIHPAMHSSDICCSMAISIFGQAGFASSTNTGTDLLDAGMKLSHFGGRKKTYRALCPSQDLMDDFERNKFLSMMGDAASATFGTQGDGNHFFFVGRVRSTGQIALVTHHGSRKPGAMLFDRGMACAESHRRKIAPDVPEHQAWIPTESDDGREYWAALQLIRRWTKKSHFAIHDACADALGLKVKDRFWNEHNFVFQKSDGLFYHAKGATPAYDFFSDDTNNLTLIPLNMAEPILMAKTRPESGMSSSLGFAPHGAGRNFSRGKYLRMSADRPVEEIIRNEAKGIDVRYFSGIPDKSELPSAYKSAKEILSQIKDFDLCDIVDYVDPIGNIMAGDWQRDAPWRKKRG